LKRYSFFIDRRTFFLIVSVCLAVCVACGQVQAAGDNNSEGDYELYAGSSSDGSHYSSVLSSSRVASQPSFHNLPTRVVLTEGEYYYREFSVQYIFSDSLKIALVDGYNADDAVIDMGGGRAFFYLTADHTMVDSTFLFIFSARHGRINALDTVIVSVANRPLEIVSIIPDVSSEILVSERPIRLEFNEPIDPRSIENGVIISDIRGEKFDFYYTPGENALIIDNPNRRLPSRDTITVNITSNLLDLAGYPILRPHRLIFTTGPVVYPGDANDDGIVDKNDLIPLARYWGYSGPTRTVSQELEWSAQPAHSWDEFMAGFADVNGDGIVDGGDVCGIIANWGKKTGRHTLGKYGPSVAPEKLLARSDQTVLKDLYTAVINCPDGDGRRSAMTILESLLFDDHDNLPGEYSLFQNYPNPFNLETIIEYYLPEPAQLTIGVYNIIGQKVYDLYNGFAPEGFGSVTWYGVDNFGKPVASGIYFYRLETESLALTKRMILIR
jgi:hypothetical protein